MNALPKELTNIVFEYCDPWKETRKRLQKKTNRLFDQMRKMTIYKTLQLTDYYSEKGYRLFGEVIKIHPTVKEMIQFPISYKNDRRKIVCYLERKDDEEIEERNSMYE